jgi:hypothetical protein
MNLAARDWRDSRMDQVLKRLHAQVPRQADEPDFRGFEWFYFSAFAISTF